MNKKTILKTALFLIIFGIILSALHKVIVSTTEYSTYQRIGGFYEEKENSLDAVYIGASSVHAFYEPPIAWHDYGITVYPFTSGGQPLDAVLYLIKEARKTQPNALYIINTNGVYDSVSEAQIHRLIEYMPFSMNRLDLINHLCDIRGNTLGERMEFYFPMIRFHFRWKELNKSDFNYVVNGMKGVYTYSSFLGKSIDATPIFRSTTRRTEIRDSLQKSLEDLLDYCDDEGVRVLFVTSPQAKPNEILWARINSVNDLAQSRGYPYLNLFDYMDEMAIDIGADYCDENHTNIHGALKATKFLAEYLVKNYTFKDKRGESQYANWDASYDKFMKVIMPYVLDIETNYEKRDYTLPIPKLNDIVVDGTTLTVSWKVSNGAEGYRVYRKKEDSPWEIIAEVSANVLRYADNKCVKDKIYTYTVVPWHMVDGEKAWGRFDITGIRAKALLNAPKLVSVGKIDDGVKITWKKVKGAAGYKVFRRLPDKNWIMLRDVGNTDSYVDTAVLDDVPFCYTVRGYTLDKENRKIDGSYDPAGLLYLPDLTMTTVVAAVNNGEVTLTWDAAEGMNGYKIYRNEELIAELPDSAVQFTDRPGYGQYKYRVEAFFKFGSDVHTFNLNNAFEWGDGQ